MTRELPEFPIEAKRRIFDIAVKHLGINDDDRSLWSQFDSHWPECLEFRILFFSGVKVRYRPGYSRPSLVYVDCYPEELRDYGPTIEAINIELEKEGLKHV